MKLLTANLDYYYRCKDFHIFNLPLDVRTHNMKMKTTMLIYRIKNTDRLTTVMDICQV